MGRNIKDMKIITCHLGNGSSITAVDGGRSVDTSMGFTPLGGIIMGTRSGSLDPSVVTYIAEKEHMDGKQLSELLNKKSGYLGVEGNKRAILASDIQRYQVKKYIGSYMAAMGGLDALVFTGGIGENSLTMREEVCADMECFGIKIDQELNIAFNSKEKDISTEDARVRTWIIPTNEELMIARDTMNIVNKIK